MAQKGFDALVNVTESRYMLSRVVGQRAAQLKRGVPSMATGKVVPREQNAVSAAMEELEHDSGVIWGEAVPGNLDVRRAVEADERARREEAPVYSIMQDVPVTANARTVWEEEQAARHRALRAE